MTQIKATLSIALLLLFSTAGFAQEENRQAAQTNWPMERGDVTSSGAVKDSIGDEFEIDWEFKYPKGAFESSPIIVANKDTRTVFVAGIDVNVKGKLFSIDLDSGKTNWEFAIEEGFVSSPAWHEGRVYVPDLSGLIHCINADNGEEQWSFETEGKISSGGNFFESLVLFGSEDATLYAIDRESGELQWSHTIDDQIQCGATVAGDRCFLAGCVAYRYDRGSVWRKCFLRH